MTGDVGHIFDPGRLARLAEARREAYREAEPFPHTVIDDFMSADVLDRVLAEFPPPDGQDWFRRDTDWERKLSLQDELRLPDYIRYVLYCFNSATFLGFVEALTGIEGLIPDPYFDGGGLHNIVESGKLGVHVDFSRQEKLGLERRLNVLLYLNRDWQESWGGLLELWTADMSRCVKRVAPLFNRCVIFTLGDHTYHGHPDPLRVPPGVSRKSLALYYYTSDRPAEARRPGHSTIWGARPGASDRLKVVRDVLRLFEPPIVQLARRRLRDRLRGSG